MAIFYFCSLVLLSASYVNGEQSSCEVTSSENCPQSITYRIQEKLANEGLSLTLSSRQRDKTETVALLGFVGFYMCSPANGYTCETEDNTTFVITTPCIPGIKFTISVDGGLPIPCTEKIQESQQTTDSTRQNDTNCQEDKSEANSLDTNKLRNKRSAGIECPDDSPSTETDVVGKAVGISFGVGLLVAAVIVATVYFCVRRIRTDSPEPGTKLQDEENKFLPGDQRCMNEAEEAEGSNP